ncbi:MULTISPECIES: hypothetical protein [Capnocytophaga]|uniref:Type VI secretion system baseplate subunit TssK n=1 Tax=Capnocytophaga canis TaxID=1848903 RepID=A0A3A1YDH3_9FLAO|nr:MULTISPECIES: hypothetical protein [Capnocytophaga]AWL78017.1 hypothetical protein DKB58_03150 [Capnocytophaga canimorsus]AYW36652.1 hypothetical protein D8L92_04590 [Capnocytophaga canimorsus]MDT9499319.1 hypothetical protein [Capnocytophaga canimorsus]RIY35208.1 hypothetical protein CKY20_11125 [Capnocytophaga canis]
MIQSIKHLAVNWVDGMKVSEKHFITHDNHITDTIRDANSLRINKFNYGLLPQWNKEDKNTLFDIYNTATNDVQLVIRSCSAVTAAGFRIELRDYKVNIKSLLQKNQTNDSSGGYYILISVNPYERIPYGDIDPEEKPPRYPYTVAKYHIDVMSSSSFNEHQVNGNFLAIGKVAFNGEMVQADQSFIPPCTTVSSFPKMMDYYSNFAKLMGDIQSYSINIVQKSTKSGQNSVLANNIKLMCSTIVNHIANVYFSYRNQIPELPPIYMIEIFSQMALHLHNTTQSIAASELEEMLNYTYEWSDIAPHTLLNQLSVVAEINYNHNNCSNHMANIELLLQYLDSTFKKLNDLDYIGQRKENIIVNEQEIAGNSKIQKGWSVLD